MTKFMASVLPIALISAASVLTGCSDPDQDYRDKLQADFDRYQATGEVPPPEDVPMPSEKAKAEALAEVGGRASLTDISGQPGDDPAALREVQDSYVAYYNMPFGASGEREAWIRFMRATNRAAEMRNHINPEQR